MDVHQNSNVNDGNQLDPDPVHVDRIQPRFCPQLGHVFVLAVPSRRSSIRQICLGGNNSTDEGWHILVLLCTGAIIVGPTTPFLFPHKLPHVSPPSSGGGARLCPSPLRSPWQPKGGQFRRGRDSKDRGSLAARGFALMLRGDFMRLGNMGWPIVDEE